MAVIESAFGLGPRQFRGQQELDVFLRDGEILDLPHPQALTVSHHILHQILGRGSAGRQPDPADTLQHLRIKVGNLLDEHGLDAGHFAHSFGLPG